MSGNNIINEQITDAVTQTNVPMNGQHNPATEEGIVETDMEEGIEKAAENAAEE